MKESARGSLDTMDAIKIDHEHGEKAESFGGSGIPKAFSHVGWWWVTFSPGIHPRWIKSLLISREAHSPIPEPSSFRLLGSPLYPVYPSSNVSLPSQSLSFRDRGLCLFRLFFFFFEFSSVFSTPLKKLPPPAETNSTFLLIPLLRAA